MKDIFNFIPATFSECRALLEELRGKTSADVKDREGYTEHLNKAEINELVRLIEGQIGEKAPKAEAPAPEKPKVEEPKPETPKKPATKKTAKK